MTEKTHAVPNGVIHYWMNDFQPGRAVLVFLPGLTADHRLFDKQVEAFESTYNLLAWDAPGHGKSRPFVMDFTLAQKAAWLHAILQAEGITAPVLVGQSVGGYLSQAYIQAYPGEVRGFVSIDSAPLKRKYMSDKEFWMLNHIGPRLQRHALENAAQCRCTGHWHYRICPTEHARDGGPVQPG